MATGIIITDRASFAQVFPPSARQALAARLDLIGDGFTREEVAARPELLAEVDFLFMSWNGPVLDAAFLRSAPRLKAVLHAAGTVKPFVTPAFWTSGIPITSAQEANGYPVADFAHAQITLALKGFWRLSRAYRTRGRIPSTAERKAGPGLHAATVGLVSFGGIARRLATLLRRHRVEVIAYDPYIDPAEAAAFGVRLVPLVELFERSDVVSCHAPLTAETTGMIDRALLSRLKPDATFLNTARGPVVCSADLYAVLAERPDLTALLDVTHPEPLPPDSPAHAIPNLVISPHIAGSVGHECALLAEAMIAELDRYLAGQGFLYQVNESQLALST